MPTTFDNSMLKLVNKGSKPFRGRYQQDTLEIKPGQEMYVPYAAAVAWFGNPTLLDSGRHKDRQDEWHRVRVMWSGERANDEVNWPNYAPKVEVYTVDGERYWMVHDDPMGENMTVGTGEVTYDNQIDLLRKQVESLTKALNNLTQPQPGDDLPTIDELAEGEDEDDGVEREKNVTTELEAPSLSANETVLIRNPHGEKEVIVPPKAAKTDQKVAKKAGVDTPDRPPVSGD